MKKTLIAFFVLAVLVAACPVFAVDVSKEPTGFRGIKWDTPVTSYPNTFKRVNVEGLSLYPGQAAYTKIKEKKSFAGHQINYVLYFFDSVGFTGALVILLHPTESELSIYFDFVGACSLQWGEGVELQDPVSGEDGRCEWEFPSSRAVVNCLYSHDAITLLVESRAGVDRGEKERRSLEGETDF